MGYLRSQRFTFQSSFDLWKKFYLLTLMVGWWWEMKYPNGDSIEYVRAPSLRPRHADFMYPCEAHQVNNTEWELWHPWTGLDAVTSSPRSLPVHCQCFGPASNLSAPEGYLERISTIQHLIFRQTLLFWHGWLVSLPFFMASLPDWKSTSIWGQWVGNLRVLRRLFERGYNDPTLYFSSEKKHFLNNPHIGF